jgi:hypothetical protein
MAEEGSKTKKAATEVENVQMQDGRTVGFAGKRKMVKDVNAEAGTVRFDFRNGESRTFEIPDTLLRDFAAHGASQKIGDETAGVEAVEDMVVAVDTIIDRLLKGEWTATRAAGDSFAGASIVIRAICEVTGKSLEEIKAFLQGKLDTSKAAAEASGSKALTRKELYDSFRKPGSKTAVVIDRLEKEKLSKNSAVEADDLLNELA